MPSSAPSAADAGTRLRRPHRVAVALVGAALAAGVTWSVVRDRFARAGDAPGVVVRARNAPEAGEAPNDAREERAMSLALASAPPAERRRLLERMRYATARLEARLSPLGDDLGDDEGDAEDQFRREAARYAPALIAARAIAAESAGRRDLDVRLVARCEGSKLAPEETCFALWDAPGSGPPLAEQARFLVWAASRAAVFELPARDAAEACARVLREKVLDDGSVIALVLTAEDLALRQAPDREELIDAARQLGRAMAANGLRDAHDLDTFAHVTPPGQVAPWLTLSSSSVLVVPRLSALVRVAEIAREVEAATSCKSLRWIHAP